jgi:F0F1-type ATP synthase gamma subunit
LEDFSEVIKDNIEISDSKLVSKNIVAKYATQEYDKIVVIYSYYYSAITQKALAKQFLAIDKEDIINYLEEIVGVEVANK